MIATSLSDDSEDNNKSSAPRLITPELAETIRNFSEIVSTHSNAQSQAVNQLLKQVAETTRISSPISVPEGFRAEMRRLGESLSQTVRAAPDGVIPQNWPPGSLSNLTAIQTILQEDGIPSSMFRGRRLSRASSMHQQ